MPAEIDIVCVSCDKVAPLDETWESSGRMDEQGRMLGVCAHCRAPDEEQKDDDDAS